MAEIELKDIVNGIEKLFTGNNHFVFWYDENGAFADNIEELREKLKERLGHKSRR